MHRNTRNIYTFAHADTSHAQNTHYTSTVHSQTRTYGLIHSQKHTYIVHAHRPCALPGLEWSIGLLLIIVCIHTDPGGGGGGYSPQILVGMCQHGKVKNWQALRNEQLRVERENVGLRNELESFWASLNLVSYVKFRKILELYQNLKLNSGHIYLCLLICIRQCMAIHIDP